MKRLFLFNPENDIALGMGLQRITPPRQAALLHRAGAMLPAWLGDAGDFVFVEQADLEAAQRWRVSIAERYGIQLPIPISEITAGNALFPEPFGWSYDTIAQFERMGVASQLLAAQRARMEQHRLLSHRRSALHLLQSLQQQGVELHQSLPVEANSMTAVEQAVGEFSEAYIKSPWSSSGRGVFPVSIATLAISADRIQGIINRQGSVMIEPQLPKLQDFAMLFKDGEFEGYSLFFNSTATNYGGNFVASDERILEQLSQWVAPAKVEALRKAVEKALAAVLGDEFCHGCLGVDMMICGRPDETPWIAPCVEINLRATMGFVARGVYQKFGREGVMSIMPKAATGSLGTGIDLTPENPWFSFRFCEQA
jgi:hypothetical protein